MTNGFYGADHPGTTFILDGQIIHYLVIPRANDMAGTASH